jgi:hypothetical protein
MAPPRKKARSLYKFQRAHEAKFGLRVCERDSANCAVKSVVCRFCVVFGREEKIGTNRKATGRSKYFETFRTDHYIHHLTQQHPQKWSEYSKLDGPQEQEAFFNAVDVPFANTIDAHYDVSGNLRFSINKSIVEVIIGDMLFNPDDTEGVTRARALSLFKLVESDQDDNVADDEDNPLIAREEYVAVIKTANRTSVTDFSLESILHCKKYKALNELERLL